MMNKVICKIFGHNKTELHGTDEDGLIYRLYYCSRCKKTLNKNGKDLNIERFDDG